MYIALVISVLALSSISEATDVSDIELDTLDALLDGLDDLFKFSVDSLLNDYGYPLEKHEVVTEDGYILELHRIPHGRNESLAETRPVVLLMHGLVSSSVDYFLLGPNRSLALSLADAGYDVWLGNNRGNTWSRKHQTLDPDLNATYWDFSFHQLGVYDLPAIIDHILNTTGQQTVSYVGHSQGTTQSFVLASMKPEYNNKINVLVALAPVAYVQNVKVEFVQVLKDYYAVFDVITNALNITYFLPHSSVVSMALSLMCSDRSSLQNFCATIYTFLGGETIQLNKTTLPIIVQSFPAGSSMKAQKHYLQEVKSGKFRQFDYGVPQNLAVYGQADPPDYNITKITVPVALYEGGTDVLAVTTDIDRFEEQLPNIAYKSKINYYSHTDFLFAIDVNNMNTDIVKLIDKYSGIKEFVINSNNLE